MKFKSPEGEAKGVAGPQVTSRPLAKPCSVRLLVSRPDSVVGRSNDVAWD